MNDLQKIAYTEGYNQIAHAFEKQNQLDTATLTNWVNGCTARDNTNERSIQLVERNADGDMTQATTLHGGRSEMCSYRLLGAFGAVETIRAGLAKTGVTFTEKLKT